MEDRETPLAGGNATPGVARVGDTVRKPVGPWTDSVHRLLVHLAAQGFTGAPRSLGVDDAGRHVLEYVEGETVASPGSQVSLDDLRAVGRVIREFHDAVRSFGVPADAIWFDGPVSSGADLIAHHDLGPWNVVRTARGFVFIDWDGARPGTAVDDLAYAALGFVPIAPGTDERVAARRLVAVADGYGLEGPERAALADGLAPSARAMHEFLRVGRETGRAPWDRLWDEGHGATWLAMAEYAEAHDELWRRALRGSSGPSARGAHW